MVFIVIPNCRKKIYAGLDEFAAIQPNVYAGMFEADLTRKGIDCEILDLEVDNISNSDGAGIVLSQETEDIIVISAGHNPSSSTMKMPGVIDFCKEVRKRNSLVRISLWGVHPNALPDRSLYETGATRVISGIGDVDFRNLPPMNWEKIDPYKYRCHNWHAFGDLDNRIPYAVLLTSLGCPYNCSFCCSNGNGGYKVRDIDNVIAELDFLVTKLGVRNIKISDDLFAMPSPRVVKFCETIIDRGYDLNMWCLARTDTLSYEMLELLKKAGLNWIAYGFESVNQHSLDEVGKENRIHNYDYTIKISREVGLNIIADVVIGFWNDTYGTIQDLYHWLVDKNFEYVNLYPLFAFPGTPLYKQAIDKGLLSEPKSWEQYSLFGFDTVPLPTKELESYEVLSMRDSMFESYIKRFDYLKMIEEKFGEATRRHMEKLAEKKLPRRIIEEKMVYCSHAR